VREREKQEKMEQSTSWRSNSERRKAVAAEPGEMRRDSSGHAVCCVR
jgi:hypothetical protein